MNDGTGFASALLVADLHRSGAYPTVVSVKKAFAAADLFEAELRKREELRDEAYRAEQVKREEERTAQNKAEHEKRIAEHEQRLKEVSENKQGNGG